MKLKNTAKALFAAALLSAVSVSASAATVVLDGWQLVAPPSGVVTNIGRLNLSSGIATVVQEVGADNKVFAGAKFEELGYIFSVGYTPENTVGPLDTVPVGFPATLPTGLKISFDNVKGHVTSVAADGSFHYVFDSGNFLISGQTGLNYASGDIIGVGGASSTPVIGGINGDSTLLGIISNILLSTFDLRDNMGVSLKPELATGQVLFEAVTNNLAGANSVSLPQACSIQTTNASSQCLVLQVGSGGDAYLVRQVPEPGTLALAGFALLGLGAARRRRTSAK